MTGGRRRLRALFMAVTGLVGWAVVIAASRELTLPPVADLEAAALSLAVVAGARALSFPLPGLGGVEISLDSAIFIAAAVCFGPALTAAGVALVLAVDGLRRARLQHALYVSGVGGALLFGWSRVFAIDDAGPPGLWTTASFGGAFLCSYYLVQALQQWLGGASWPAALRRNVYSVACEAT